MKAIGFLNLSGNIFSPNGSNLSLNKTAGIIWGMGINGSDYTDPHKLTLPQLTALSFRYRLQNGTEFGATTSITPSSYDLNGTLTAIGPNNTWTIQHINIFQSNQVRIQYGQNLYGTFLEARNAIFTENFNVEQNIADNAIFRAYLIVKKTTTDLIADIASGNAVIIHVDKFGNASGGSGGSVTFANIIAALGYTPENVANKQNSLAIDGFGIKYPTVDAVNIGLNLKANILSPTFSGTVSLPTNTSIGTVSSTEITYLIGATGNIQSQINDRELIANKQNSLVADGTGVKYPTVDAINNAHFATTDIISSVIRQEFLWVSGTQSFTLSSTYSQVYSVDIQGQGALSTSQYTLTSPNIVTILDTLDVNDYVIVLYGTSPFTSLPYYTQSQVDALLIANRATPQKTITGNVTLDDTYDSCIVKVKANAIITIPNSLKTNFNCVFRTFTGSSGTFLAGGGVTMDAQRGLLLSPFRMATLFKDDGINTFILEGELS